MDDIEGPISKKNETASFFLSFKHCGSIKTHLDSIYHAITACNSNNANKNINDADGGLEAELLLINAQLKELDIFMKSQFYDMCLVSSNERMNE